MRKYWLPVLVVFLLSKADNQLSDSPTGLMVEFIRDPANVPVMDLNPEFSWIVPAKAKYQTAYQILIASSAEKLEMDIADLWDSHKVLSNRSSEVELREKPLSKNTSFFWKVRIWNTENEPTEYSAIQPFSTGNPVNYLTTGNKFQETLIAPEKFIKTGDNHYFVDFGKDAFGTLLLKINPVAEDTLIVHLGEQLSEKYRINTKPEGTIRYQKVLLPVKPGLKEYTLKLLRDSRNTETAAVHLPDSFGIIAPFRYCEIENCRFDLEPSDIKQKAYWYFFDDATSSFNSSDTILNKIWDICKYSIKATSFTGVYIDGDRERIPYEADSYINQLGHYYVDREYSMARTTNEYFITHPTWPTEWIMQTIPMFYNDFLFTGNIESVKFHYEELKHKTLIELAREDGLISSKRCTDEIMKRIGFSNEKDRLMDIVDWPASQKDTGWKLAKQEGERDGYDMVEYNTVVNAFHYHSLKLMSELAGLSGEKMDSALFGSRAYEVKRIFNEKLLNKTTGIYIDGESSQHSSLHANMMALAFNLVPEENKKAVIDFIKSRGMACSVYGAQYLLEGLYSAGEADYALSLLTATNDRSWWNMIRSGSTITMEAWDMKYKPNSDWNHAWGAAPANIIPRYMWGIGPAAAGYSKAIIKPQLSNLKYSKILVPTIRGNIEAEYKVTASSKEFSIVIPGNMECDFVLPVHKASSVFLDNKKVETGTILKLNPGINNIVIKTAF